MARTILERLLDIEREQEASGSNIPGTAGIMLGGLDATQEPIPYFSELDQQQRADAVNVGLRMVPENILSLPGFAVDAVTAAPKYVFQKGLEAAGYDQAAKDISYFPLTEKMQEGVRQGVNYVFGEPPQLTDERQLPAIMETAMVADPLSWIQYAPAAKAATSDAVRKAVRPFQEGGTFNPKRVEGVVESPRIRLLEQQPEQAQLTAPQPKLPFIAEPEVPKPSAPVREFAPLADDGGQPITLYRGQAYEGPAKPSKGRKAFLGEGIYASQSKNLATGYAGTKEGSRVDEIQMDIRSPFIIEADTGVIPYPLNQIVDSDLIMRPGVTDAQVAEVTQQLKDQGYDGVLAYYGLDRETGKPNIYEAVAFDESQVRVTNKGKPQSAPVPEEEIQNFIVTGKQPYSWNLSDTQVDIPMDKLPEHAWYQMADPRMHWKHKDATLYDPRSESELVPMVADKGDMILKNSQADVNDLQWNWAHRAPTNIMNMSKEQFKPPMPDNPNEVEAYSKYANYTGRDPESGKWIAELKPSSADRDYLNIVRKDEILAKPKTLGQVDDLWHSGFRPKRGTDAFDDYKTWPEMKAAILDKKVEPGNMPLFEFRDRKARTKENYPLVAQHNVSDFQSLEALVNEGGGKLTAPSLSVSPAENPNDQFGKISLLFDPKIIDEPTTASYSADAYTGRTDLPKKRFLRNDVYDGLRKKLPTLKNLDNAQLEKYYNQFLDQLGIGVARGRQQYHFDEFIESLGVLDSAAAAEGQTVAEHLKLLEDLGGMSPWEMLYTSRGKDDMPGSGAYADPIRVFSGDAAPTIGPKGAIPAYPGSTYGGERGVDTFVGPLGLYSPERALQAWKARKGMQKGGEGIINNRALVSKKFSGLADMQQNRHLIETDETQYPWARNAYRNQWSKIQKDIRDVVQANEGGDYDSQNAIGEQFATKLLNDEKVKEFFGKDPWSKGDIENITRQIKDWQQYFGEMVPGDYFESKVGRNVSLNEVRLAMIPTDFISDPDLLNKTIKLLQDAGVQKVLTYGSRKERESILKKHPELLLTITGMTLMAPILLEQEQADGATNNTY